MAYISETIQALTEAVDALDETMAAVQESIGDLTDTLTEKLGLIEEAVRASGTEATEGAM